MTRQYGNKAYTDMTGALATPLGTLPFSRDGWNVWVTFVISPAEQTPAPSASRRMITK